MLIRKLKKRFQFRIKRGREPLLFLISLFIAFLIWSIDKLSDRYTHIFQYKVQLFEAYKADSEPFLSQNRLSFRAEATGFEIIKYHFNRYTNTPVVLNLEAYNLKSDGSSQRRSYLLTSQIKDRIVNLFNNKYHIEYFITDTLFYNLEEIEERSLPIKLNYNISFKEQYIALSEPKLTPSSITVWGSRERVEEIDTLYTETLVINGSEGSEVGVIGLRAIPGIRFSQEEVLYSIESVRYVEVSQEVNIEIVNIPKGWSAEVVPPIATLYLREQMDKSHNLKKFTPRVVLDCKRVDLSTSRSVDTIVPPLLERVPDGAIDYRLEPPFVQIELYKNRE